MAHYCRGREIPAFFCVLDTPIRPAVTLLDGYCNILLFMKCYNAISAQNALVPCGQCMNCRINKGRHWTSRILMELVTSDRPAYFLTLTYNDENVPRTDQEYVPTLRRQQFQTWLKNTNQNHGPFRYYAVGEYGDDTLRPHYHMALFPGDGCSVDVVTNEWRKGFVSAYPMSATRAQYLANYTTKKLTSNTDSRLKDGQEPEFRSSSRHPGLGAAFVPVVVSQYGSGAGKAIVDERGDIERVVRFGPKIYPIPKFILDKCRKELGIPLTHKERMCHPGYYEWHQQQEAEQCEKTFIEHEVLRNAEKKRWKYRSTTTRV